MRKMLQKTLFLFLVMFLSVLYVSFNNEDVLAVENTYTLTGTVYDINGQVVSKPVTVIVTNDSETFNKTYTFKNGSIKIEGLEYKTRYILKINQGYYKNIEYVKCDDVNDDKTFTTRLNGYKYKMGFGLGNPSEYKDLSSLKGTAKFKGKVIGQLDKNNTEAHFSFYYSELDANYDFIQDEPIYIDVTLDGYHPIHTEMIVDSEIFKRNTAAGEFLDLSLNPIYTMKGTVKDENGNLIKNNIVEIIENDTGKLVSKVKTDKNGNYSYRSETLKPGETYRACAVKEGYDESCAYASLYARNGIEIRNIILQKLKKTDVLIIDVNNKPIENVKVIDEKGKVLTSTNKEGKIIYLFPDNKSRLVILEKEGYYSKEIYLRNGDEFSQPLIQVITNDKDNSKEETDKPDTDKKEESIKEDTDINDKEEDQEDKPVIEEKEDEKTEEISDSEKDNTEVSKPEKEVKEDHSSNGLVFGIIGSVGAAVIIWFIIILKKKKKEENEK